MPDRGMFGGLGQTRWTQYEPKWRAGNFAGSAPATQPALGTGGSLVGKYLRHPAGFVIAQILLQLGTSPTIGSGASFWALSLPYPANRLVGDLPIGNGYATMGISASVQTTQSVVPTLADPASGFTLGGQTDSDYWIQGFSNRMIAYGISGDANSPAFTSGASSVTVTHNLGSLGGWIPAAYDIKLVATNSPSTNPKTMYVANMTSTTFDIVLGASSTTTPLTYAWKIEGEPNGTGNSILIGPTSPWVWGSGHSLGYSVVYETRR